MSADTSEEPRLEIVITPTPAEEPTPAQEPTPTPAQEPTPTPTPSQEPTPIPAPEAIPKGKRERPVDIGFACSIPGLFKLVEFVFVLLGLVIVATVESYYTTSTVQNFMLVHAAGVVFILLHYFLQLFRVCQKIPGYLSHGMTISVCCILAWILFLVSSAHLLKTRYDLDQFPITKSSILEKLAAGGSFGIIVSFVFLLEAVFNFVTLTAKRQKAAKPVNGQSNPGY